jgi:pimeloyl-ACP methyl ester carboxylesterase
MRLSCLWTPLLLLASTVAAGDDLSLLRSLEQPPGHHTARLKLRSTEGSLYTFDGMLTRDGSTVARFVFTRRARGSPVVVLFPTLGGNYLEVKVLASAFAGRGLSSFYILRPGRVLVPERSAHDLDVLCREGVRHARAILECLTLSGDIAPGPAGCVGMSMGAIVAPLMAAAEPRITSLVPVLGGADVPRIMAETREGLIRRYMERRARFLGTDERAVLEEYRRDFHADPLMIPGVLDPGRILMVQARYDQSVPRSAGDRLHQVLGRPTRVEIPAGHYTAVVFVPIVFSRIIDFIQRGLTGSPVRLTRNA